jgi:hypothetical protein
MIYKNLGSYFECIFLHRKKNIDAELKLERRRRKKRWLQAIRKRAESEIMREDILKLITYNRGSEVEQVEVN